MTSSRLVLQAQATYFHFDVQILAQDSRVMKMEI